MEGLETDAHKANKSSTPGATKKMKMRPTMKKADAEAEEAFDAEGREEEAEYSDEGLRLTWTWLTGFRFGNQTGYLIG